MLALPRGDGNPGLWFGDGLDTIASDARYLVGSIDASLAKGERAFDALVIARWGLRGSDRISKTIDGNLRESPTSLVDVTFSTTGKPHRDVTLLTSGSWDARIAKWTSFDASAAWQVKGGPVTMRYEGSLIPATTITATSWLHRPGVTIRLSRYYLHGWIDVRSTDTSQDLGTQDNRTRIDLWHAGFSRRCIDGILTFGYEERWLLRDPHPEHSLVLGFTFGGSDAEAESPVSRSFGNF